MQDGSKAKAPAAAAAVSWPATAPQRTPQPAAQPAAQHSPAPQAAPKSGGKFVHPHSASAPPSTAAAHPAPVAQQSAQDKLLARAQVALQSPASNAAIITPLHASVVAAVRAADGEKRKPKRDKNRKRESIEAAATDAPAQVRTG